MNGINYKNTDRKNEIRKTSKNKWENMIKMIKIENTERKWIEKQKT